MRKLMISALLLIPLCLHAQHTISGKVVDADTGNALPGATLQLASTSHITIAESDGTFVFTGLTEGTYVIHATFVGYSQQSIPVQLAPDASVTIRMQQSFILSDEVVVEATRASGKTPTTHSTIDRETISKQNFGQDLPILLNWSPSVVTTSDAGTGIGYTGIRIRGSDATRINVTINGIPYNDSESLGTFWVDIPDIASSSESIQVQRGLGSSTNGAGAFGATINLQTNKRNETAYADISNSYGSFNSRKHTLNFGTGLLGDHWIVDGRISRIYSDGFIDRATADLQSYYLSAGYYANNSMLKAVLFGGKERTYQSWYGVPESRLNDDTEAMLMTAANEGWNDIQTNNLLSSGSRTFNPYLYENQVDDYRQDHYQLHFSQRLSELLSINTALHYTPGRGFYEEYKYDDNFSDYGLPAQAVGDSVIESSDIVRRRWLDNHFYGFTYSLNYDTDKLNIVFGGAGNRYVGDHFGEIIWAEVAPVPPGYRYYFNDSDKRDFNAYLKTIYQATPQLSAFVDLQYRKIQYEAAGIENELNAFAIDTQFDFFNPKAGLTFAFDDHHTLYGSFGLGNHEPVRNDFIDNTAAPSHEALANLELGYRNRGKRHTLHVNYYLMRYHNQLVLTGALNDVGASIRTNVDKSYRTGIELDGMLRISDKVQWSANATLSRNRIEEFREVLFDYATNANIERVHNDTDISFSPSVIAGSSLSFQPLAGLELTWLAKYVGRQFLDNTSNNARSLDAYFTNDLRISYRWKPRFIREIGVSLLLNNIADEKYSSNGYTWGYLYGQDEYRENYFFPQAGRNFMVMATMRF